MSRLRKVLATAICIAMATGTLAVETVSAAFNDTGAHWANEYIERMVDAGIVKGDTDGRFRPDSPVTRAEFATMINRAFYNGIDTAEINFADVSQGDWYYSEIAKAVNAGYLQGNPDNTASPKDNIKRQDVAVITDRVLIIPAGDASFTDMNSVSNYAELSVKDVAGSGIVNGYPDKSFGPAENLTRAEAAVIVERMMALDSEISAGYVLKEKSLSGTTIEGNLTITLSETALDNVTVTGDLLIAKSVGNGDVYLNNVTVKGSTYVYGGGANSIKARNSSFGRIHLNFARGNARMELRDSKAESMDFLTHGELSVVGESTVSMVTVPESFTSDSKVVIDGNVEKVVINSGAEVSVNGAVKYIEINVAADLTLEKGAEVGELAITADAAGATVAIDKDATLEVAVVDAAMDFVGEGAADKAVINSEGVTAETVPAQVEGEVADIEETADSTTDNSTTDEDSTGSSNSGGGSSGGSNNTDAETPAAMVATYTERAIGGQITITNIKANYSTATHFEVVGSADTSSKVVIGAKAAIMYVAKGDKVTIRVYKDNTLLGSFTTTLK